MKTNLFRGPCILAVAVLIGCSAEKTRPALTYYHGQTPPDSYFEVVSYTPQEIEFRIKVKFGSKHMYPLILEGDEPLAEGWFPTMLGAADSYRLVIKAREGVAFETGKTYRLCIGGGRPQKAAGSRRTLWRGV